LQIKTKIVSNHAADSKPVKKEVNCTVILPPLVFPGLTITALKGFGVPAAVDETPVRWFRLFPLDGVGVSTR
jgi:hypothetical protein